MPKSSTLLYYYTLSENKEESAIYDLNNLDQIDSDNFADVYHYLDSLLVEPPESLVKLILNKI